MGLFRNRRFQLGMGLFVLMVVGVPVFIAMSHDQADGRGFERDAEAYAEMFDVSLAEARERLRLQEEIGSLDGKLTDGEAATFGGLWVEHSPAFKVKVGFTENGAATLSRYEKSDDLGRALETVDVTYTLSELMGKQGDADGMTERTAVRAESSVNVPGNVVEVYTTDADGLKDALSENGDAMSDGVVVKAVDALTTPAHGWRLHGGEYLTDCTSGFAVRVIDDYDEEDNPVYGESGITSAGHCDPDQDRGPTQLRFKRGLFGGSVDVQWYTAEDDDYTPDNTVWDGTGHRHVSSTRPRSLQSIGMVVCHFGKVTGHGCGTLTSKTYRPS